MKAVNNEAAGKVKGGKMNEKLLNLIATNINDIIAIHGLDGECRYISPSVQKILGYSPEEFVGTVAINYYYPDDAPRISELIGRARAGMPVMETRCEYRFRRKDGSYCWLESEANRILDAAGNPTELLVISRDITARKRAEQDLQNSYDRMRLAIDGAKAGVWGFDHSDDWRGACRQWWAILGYSEGEVASTREEWLNLCHPEDRGLVERALADYLAGRAAKFELEYRVRDRGGNYRWVLVNGRPACSQDDEAPRWSGLVIDITERKRLEAVQLESERRLRDFAQAIPDVSMIVDERGHYVEIFGRDGKFLPWLNEDLRGSSLHQLLPAREAGLLLNRILRTISTGQPQEFDLELAGGDGRQFAEVRMAPMNYLAGGKKTVAVVFTDVSEKRRAEKLVEFTLALRRRSSFIDDVIAGGILDAEAVAAAKAFGIDLSAPLFCCIVHLESVGGVNAAADGITRKQSRIIELISNERQLFVWDCRGDIGIIHRNGSAEGGPVEEKRVAEHILDIIAAFDPRLKVAIGVGNRLYGLEGIRKSYRQAASAVLAAMIRDDGKTVCHFHDIGIYRFLANFSGKELAREYVQETLGALLEYDQKKGTDLLHTLEEILQSTSLKEASQRLFLHYNTAVLQKRRIEKILEVSIEDVETRLALAAAVKLRKLGL